MLFRSISDKIIGKRLERKKKFTKTNQTNKIKFKFHEIACKTKIKENNSKFSRSVGNLIHGTSVTGNTSVVTGIDDIGDGEMTWNYFLLL